MEIKVGTVTQEFTLLRELGRGGMGTVYLAEDHKWGKRCAVKVLHPHLTLDETMRARFRNEARAAAAIDHPAIVKIYAIDELEDRVLCCRMDYVEGTTLADYCKRRGEPLPPSLILEIIAPICEAFDLLHQLRIVHSDLKPDNVLIVQHGGVLYPKVLDFGIAKRTDEPRLTIPGTAPGTAAYMAPEQAKGDMVDRASDVYSLGVMMYWMATGGHLPYEVPDSAMYYHQVTEPPVDPRRRCSGVSDLAAGVILSALNPEAARRPRSMGALALMFSRSVEGDSIHPDGTAIIRARAPGLLVVGNLDETLRSPGSARIASAQIWRYDYGAPLGRGGMAEVVRATLRGANGAAVPRAIKLILPEFAQAPEFVKMFHEEARIALLLEHRNIVRAHEHDVDPRGRLYLAMEFVDGIDLQKLYLSGPVPHAVAIFMISEVLDALEYAHDLPPASPLASSQEIAARGDARGVVHRDVSHHNVLISWAGDVKLSDFGIAKLRTATAADGSLFIKGKAGYMSPEQAGASNKLDGRSDLWAIGVMLWELLTGQTLFNHETFAQTISAVLFDEIPRPRVVNPQVPLDLDAIVMRLLTRDLSRRFQTALDVKAALKASPSAPPHGRDELLKLLAERFPDRARPISSEQRPAGTAQRVDLSPSKPIHASWQVPSTTGHALGETVPGRPQRSRHRHRTAMLTAGAMACAILVMLGRAVTQDGGARTAQPSTAPPRSALTSSPSVPAPPATAPAPLAPSRTPAASSSTPVVVAADSQAQADRHEGGGRAGSVDEQAPQAEARANVSAPAATDAPSRAPLVPAQARAEAAAQPRPAATKPLGSAVSKPSDSRAGELVIVVKPWAMVSINGRAMGQTPYRQRLPVGAYRVRLINDNAEKDETMTVTVSRDQTTSVERSWVTR